ncbi:MAG: hypothetical protein ACRD2J_00125 [Thermoanaerobaculia bacterium]
MTDRKRGHDQETTTEHEKEIPREELREIGRAKGDGGNPEWVAEEEETKRSE